jgi:hypothetical protein
MFTYKWDKGFFYILMGDMIVDHLNKSDGEYLLKNDVLFTDHFEIEIEGGIVFFSSVEEDFEIFFTDRDGIFLSSIKEFLTGGVE